MATYQIQHNQISTFFSGVLGRTFLVLSTAPFFAIRLWNAEGLEELLGIFPRLVLKKIVLTGSLVNI